MLPGRMMEWTRPENFFGSSRKDAYEHRIRSIPENVRPVLGRRLAAGFCRRPYHSSAMHYRWLIPVGTALVTIAGWVI
jgi:hypothetical protein